MGNSIHPSNGLSSARAVEVSSSQQRVDNLFWWIIFLAIVLRAIWALLVPVIPLSDGNAYDTFALNIVQHGTYGWRAGLPSAYWPVGTSAIYALFFSIFGHTYWPITIFNILVGTGLVAVTMLLGKKLFSAKVGYIAGTILAIWPSQVMYVTVLASELPFTFLTVTGLLLWLGEKLTLTTTVAIGILLAAASYVRPLALLLPLVFAAIEIVRHRQWVQQVRRALVVCLVMIALITPWTVRNYLAFGEFVLISTNGPVTLWMGNHAGTDGTYSKLPDWTGTMSEYERAQALGKVARDYIIDHPVEFIVRSLTKLAKVHINETIAVHWNKKGIEETFGSTTIFPFKLLTQGYWMLALFTAIAGGFLLFRQLGMIQWTFHPAIALWGYFALVHAIILSQDRYHFPSIPYITILSAYALTILFRKLGKAP